MKKDLIVVFLIFMITALVWWQSLFNFFTQDDFTLINHFSQNSLIEDLKNVFGKPKVTHWRPMHNFYFFIAGNIFGKNYIGYHILTFAILILSGTIIFEIVRKLLKNKSAALIASIIYISHPSHFVSMFWISGNATLIGFLFLTWSMYFYLGSKRIISLFLYLVSLLASEAMIVGVVLYLSISHLKNNLKKDLVHLMAVFSVSAIFILVKAAYLFNQEIFDVYKVEFSLNNLLAVKYYLSRIVGFAQVSGDQLATTALILWILIVGFLLFKSAVIRTHQKVVYLSLGVIFVGLFPFILIPSHLSGHYMNVSIFGFSLAVAAALKKQKWLVRSVLVSIFIVISLINVSLDAKNSWVVNRANLAKEILTDVERKNLPIGSTLIFDDNQRATSLDAYYSLGTGEALRFWFKDKNYRTCFIFIERCHFD